MEGDEIKWVVIGFCVLIICITVGGVVDSIIKAKQPPPVSTKPL